MKKKPETDSPGELLLERATPATMHDLRFAAALVEGSAKESCALLDSFVAPSPSLSRQTFYDPNRRRSLSNQPLNNDEEERLSSTAKISNELEPTNDRTCTDISVTDDFEVDVSARKKRSRVDSFTSFLASEFLHPADDALIGDELVQIACLANEGVDQFPPESCSEGETGAYFLREPEGRKIAVFKPVEPASPLSPSSSPVVPLRKTVPQSETAIREVAAYRLDRGFAGVPATTLVRARASSFDDPEEEREEEDQGARRLGSLHTYIHHAEPAENVAPGRFALADVHRIGIFDIRSHNTDRHAGNILAVKRATPKAGDICYDLVPIDHAFCFPTAFGEASWEWLYWPQAKKPFDQETLKAIEDIDVDKDVELLRAAGLSEDALRVHKISTLLLKRGALGGLTLYEIARLCLRKRSADTEELAPIERAYQIAVEEVGDDQSPLLWDYVKFEIEILVKKPTKNTCSFM